MAAALEGLKVVEFAQGISGPYCGWLLACAGAEVVKVEPVGGDYARGFGPAPDDADSALFSAINTGKRLLGEAEAAVEDSAEAFARLLDGADVVIVDRYSPRPPAQDLNWIRAHLPVTAVLAVASPTETGEPATELEIQAQSGLLRYVGAIDLPPVRLGADVGSVLCGSFLTQAVLAALLERGRSGQGQEVAASGVGALMAIGSVMLAALDNPDEWEGFHCLSAGHPVEYGLKTADGALSFSAPRRDDEAWRALCEELGAQALAADPKYLTGNDRVPRMKELMADLSQFTHGTPRDKVLVAVERSGAMALPVQRHSEVFAQPQVTAIDAVSSLPAGRRLAPPWRINGVRPHPWHEVPGAAASPGQ
jgi:crotonobetainyl-CoA:carnitine CoA-transferase CaiB-like acyl-CoA transferase